MANRIIRYTLHTKLDWNKIMLGFFLFIFIGCAMLLGGFDDEVLKISIIVFIIFLAFVVLGSTLN